MRGRGPSPATLLKILELESGNPPLFSLFRGWLLNGILKKKGGGDVRICHISLGDFWKGRSYFFCGDEYIYIYIYFMLDTVYIG